MLNTSKIKFIFGILIFGVLLLSFTYSVFYKDIPINYDERVLLLFSIMLFCAILPIFLVELKYANYIKYEKRKKLKSLFLAVLISYIAINLAIKFFYF